LKKEEENGDVIVDDVDVLNKYLASVLALKESG